MKNIIVVSNDIFFKKNFKEYVHENNLPYKLYFFNDVKKSDKNKIKKLVKKNAFALLNSGLSGSIQYNIKYGQKIYDYNTSLYYRIISNLENLSIKKLFFLSSSCAYPSNKKILKENIYGYPPIENTSYFYSLSKIFGTNLCKQINKSKKFNYISIVPATLFGNYAKYHKVNSHVLTSLIYKINKNKKKILLWGSGNPKREFIHIKDLIDAIFFINKKNLFKHVINVGTGKDYTIKELANKIKKIKKFNGKILWNKSKKDGTFKKLLDTSYLFSKGWKPKISLDEGLKKTIKKQLKL